MGKIARKTLIGFQLLLINTPAMVALSNILKLPISAFFIPAAFATIIFHIYMQLVFGKRLPLFLGPSFLIVAILYAVKGHSETNCAYITGGFIVMAGVFLATAILIKFIGLYRFIRLFPPVVVGSMVLSIGIGLASAQSSLVKNTPLGLSGVVLATVLLLYAFVKPVKKYSLILGLLVGMGYYILTGMEKDFIHPFTPNFISFLSPKFSLSYSLMFALAGLATVLEHIGDIFAVSMITDSPYYLSPGLHNTLTANGLSALLTSFIHPSGPITYTETIGAYALIDDFDPDYALFAAFWAILIAIIEMTFNISFNIPPTLIIPFMFLAFGMISAIGIRIFVENEVNIGDSRNFIIISIMLSVAVVDIKIPGFDHLVIKGVVFAAIVGIILNLILPRREGDENREEVE